MAIEYRKSLAVFMDVVSVDDAEALLEWLQKKPSASASTLSACTHLHPANLQVLMAAKATVVEPGRQDAAFAAWLKSALVYRDSALHSPRQR
jgi:hypothetical protein